MSDTQKLYNLSWRGYKSEWVQHKSGKDLLDLVTDEKDVRPGDEVYIRGGATGAGYYQSTMSHMVHIESIRELIKHKRIWRKK